MIYSTETFLHSFFGKKGGVKPPICVTLRLPAFLAVSRCVLSGGLPWLTLDVMREPVISTAGISYEKEAIERCLRHAAVDPVAWDDVDRWRSSKYNFSSLPCLSTGFVFFFKFPGSSC